MRVVIPELNKMYRLHFRSASKKESLIYDKIIPLALFGIVGAFGWAIRGTSGWGGIAGGAIAGFWWGALFYLLAKVRGIDARWQFFAIGFGIAFGGMNGYGQFISWIRGVFSVGDPSMVESPVVETSTLPLNPAIGFMWLAIVGLEWGGNAAGFLSWTLKKPKNPKEWAIRILCPVLFAIVAFLTVKYNPNAFFPHYSNELYASEQCRIHCARTASTLPTLSLFVGQFVGFLVAETLLKNWEGLKTMAIMAVGFAIAFPLSSLWFFGNLEGFSSWWKLWEESIGLIGGISIGIAFLRLVNSAEKGIIQEHLEVGLNEESEGREKKRPSRQAQLKIDWHSHIALVLGTLVLYIYAILGASRAIIQVFSLYQLQVSGEYEITLERGIFVGVLGGLGLFYAIRNLVRAKKQNQSGQWLFPIKQPFEKFLKLSIFLAFCGLIAIYPAFMTNFYVAFTCLLVVLLIDYSKYFRERNLIPDQSV